MHWGYVRNQDGTSVRNLACRGAPLGTCRSQGWSRIKHRSSQQWSGHVRQKKGPLTRIVHYIKCSKVDYLLKYIVWHFIYIYIYLKRNNHSGMVMPVLWPLLHSIFCAALCLLLFPNRATIATLRRACLWPSLSAIFFALKFNISCWGTSWLRVKCRVSAAFLSATLPAQLSQPASLSPAHFFRVHPS